ncbi:amidase family protein [Burkholderia pseudomultivorans]|uniref:amidase family protein n=1 Tax=Burkholderia pseudomultivorans TaxID=1207504 RepID=UPI002875EB1A|nr:amidase family protein [Burkholderia pseudomultivorans]MDS0858619.1 amidase family protein [Burkholderia pseudomultivorans]
MESVLEMKASHLTAAYRCRALSPVEVMCAVLERVARFNPIVNGVCSLEEDRALAAARESERRWMRSEPCGLLDGVPVSVKDLIAVQGLPTRYGSRTSASTRAVEDAPAVAQLRQAGALLFGKTTTSEFGNKIVTDSPLTGITRNPWDLRRSPGGSSGGSAVAVALGMGPLSLATDGGGSIRVPACWSGVVGMKPTFDRVPVGAAGSWTGLSTLGPIARTVSDAALMLAVMMRQSEALRPASVSPDVRIGLDDGIAGLRIAYCPAPAGVQVEPDIAAAVRHAVQQFEALGANIEETDVKPLAGYLDSRMHAIQWSVFFAQRVRQLPPSARLQLDSDVRALAETGDSVSTSTFVDALQARYALTVAMAAFFEDYDLLLTPTFHCSPPLALGASEHQRVAPPLTSWCNQTGLPAASVPCGLPGGLPTGLQIIGPRGGDALVLRGARAYESARGPFPAPVEAIRDQTGDAEARA